jgi:hypothetical protein
VPVARITMRAVSRVTDGGALATLCPSRTRSASGGGNMSRRSAVAQRAAVLAIAGLAFGALAFARVVTQVAQSKTCAYVGRVFEPGEGLPIGGRPMVCDGSAGVWIADNG